jgi:hypothetical protein
MVRGGPQALSEYKALQKLYQSLTELKMHPHMSVLKLPLLLTFRRK